MTHYGLPGGCLCHLRFDFEDAVEEAARKQMAERAEARLKSSRTVCKHWMLGKCMMGDRCTFSHAQGSIPACEFFKVGKCAHGSHCRFRHEGVKVEEPPAQPPPKEEDEGGDDFLIGFDSSSDDE